MNYQQDAKLLANSQRNTIGNGEGGIARNTEKRTVFHDIGDIETKLREASYRADRLADRITGPVPSELVKGGDNHSPVGLVSMLEQSASIMSDRIDVINSALSRIERALPDEV